MVLAFGPGFHLGRSPRYTVPALLGLMTEGWLFCLFSGPPSVPVEMPVSKGWYSPLMFSFLIREFLVYIALISNSVTWYHYRCNSWIYFSPTLLATFCSILVRELGVSRLRSTQRGNCLPWAWWHQTASHKFSVSPPAGHLPPQRSLLFYSEGKYLLEQMMFLSS